jgi:hypothetical protein
VGKVVPDDDLVTAAVHGHRDIADDPLGADVTADVPDEAADRPHVEAAARTPGVPLHQRLVLGPPLRRELGPDHAR